MKSYSKIASLILLSISFLISGQKQANVQLATRFAPYKIKKMTYSTSLNPKWIEGKDGFWYEWKTSNGTMYYIVDPGRGSKQVLFDNDKFIEEIL